MTPDDQVNADFNKCLRVLRDVFMAPYPSQQDAEYTGGMLTKDGIAYPLTAQSDADAVDQLVGQETF